MEREIRNSRAAHTAMSTAVALDFQLWRGNRNIGRPSKVTNCDIGAGAAEVQSGCDYELGFRISGIGSDTPNYRIRKQT